MPTVAISTLIWRLAMWIARGLGFLSGKTVLIAISVLVPILYLTAPFYSTVAARISTWLLTNSLRLFAAFCLWAVQLLPSVPDLPEWYYVSQISQHFAAANRYLPLAEGAQLFATYLTIYTALATVKLIRFVKS